jgi:hypothetical protein
MESRAQRTYELRDESSPFPDARQASQSEKHALLRISRLKIDSRQSSDDSDQLAQAGRFDRWASVRQLALNLDFSPRPGNSTACAERLPPQAHSQGRSSTAPTNAGASIFARGAPDPMGEAARADRLLKLDALCLHQKKHGGRPSMLEELIEMIGEEAVVKLVTAYGGTRLYVPHDPAADDPLASSIGLPAALRLAQTYGGDRVDVPNPTPRRVRILQLRKIGLSVDAIARSLRCTRRRVFQVLAEARALQRPV